MAIAKVTKLLRRLTSPQDTEAGLAVFVLLLGAEALLCILIIWRIPYTEIDWTTYMQQVEGFLQGERDYSKLGGSTGPLVYPAGFLYVYTSFYWLTGKGTILAGQIYFAALYCMTQAVVMALYIKSKAVPPWVLILLCLSKRLHSIYVLRLFNDGVAMLVAYSAIWLLSNQRWRLSLMAFSAAVSIKMNVLLMAPAVLVIMLKAARVRDLVEGVALGAGLQIMLGAPFLLHSASAYISRSFDFSRVFIHYWSVNFKFLPEETFQSKPVAGCLLGLHCFLLLWFCQNRWCKKEGGIVQVAKAFWTRPPKVLQKGKEGSGGMRTDHMLNIIFTANFIGVMCARSLHYQFYSWYFHTLPFLLWQVEVHCIVRCGLLLIVEIIWNIFPSTAASSMGLTACHLGILLALQNQMQPYSSKPNFRGRMNRDIS